MEGLGSKEEYYKIIENFLVNNQVLLSTSRRIGVFQYDKDGKLLEQFRSKTQAQVTGINRMCIDRVIDQPIIMNGFIFTSTLKKFTKQELQLINKNKKSSIPTGSVDNK